MMRGGCHPLLSHNCTLPMDTPVPARQMWAERYILDGEANLRDRMQAKAGVLEEAGC
jgi:hypothetical protein